MRCVRISLMILVVLTASCNSVEPKVGGGDGGADTGDDVSGEVDSGADGNVPTPDFEQCACAWEGPVLFALGAVLTADEGVYVGAELAWQPCCAASSNAPRTWLVGWDGASEVVEAVPTAAVVVELPADAETPVIVAGPDGQTELSIVRAAEDSISSVTLDIGDVIFDGAQTGDITVDVSQ